MTCPNCIGGQSTPKILQMNSPEETLRYQGMAPRLFCYQYTIPIFARISYVKYPKTIRLRGSWDSSFLMHDTSLLAWDTCLMRNIDKYHMYGHLGSSQHKIMLGWHSPFDKYYMHGHLGNFWHEIMPRRRSRFYSRHWQKTTSFHNLRVLYDNIKHTNIKYIKQPSCTTHHPCLYYHQ